MASYIYRGLSVGQIRTLTVGLSPTGEIHGVLEEVQLETAEFIALSYVWGAETNKKTIYLEGEPFLVTTNAHKVLSVLLQQAQPDSSVSPRHEQIWIDAICIDQLNDDEKIGQIALMQDIYARSKSTFIHLGSPLNPYAASRVFAWIRSLLEYGRPQEWLTRDGIDQVDRFWNDTLWNDFCDLVMQPWHRRRWIVQEAVISREAWILYGDQVMLWRTFADGMQCAAYLYSSKHQLSRSRNGTPLRMCDIGPTLSMTGLRLQQPRPTALLHLLRMFRRNDCKDPRDRVIALVGLCSEEERRRNLGAATSDLKDVLINFAVTHIELHRNLDILCLATEPSRERRQDVSYWRGSVEVKPHRPGEPRSVYLPQLPTWCPNVTSPYAQWIFGHDQVALQEPPEPYFKASWDAPLGIQNLSHIRATGILIVDGIEIDEVIAVENTTPCLAPAYDDPKSGFYLAAFNLARRHCLVRYSDFTTFVTKFFRTITVGGRRNDTKLFLSDSYLRGYMYEFFRETDIGSQMRMWEVSHTIPENRQDWYMTFSHPYLQAYSLADKPMVSLHFMSMTKFVCTRNGRMALVPSHTQKGDRICIVFGCSSPVLLTPVGAAATASQRPQFQTRGEVYMDGIMHGEISTAHASGILESRTFDII